MRALIVDDEPLARRRLARLLGELGVEVAGEAEDGVEAMEAVSRLEPDVVFLDIRMPRLDGLTLALEGGGSLPPVVFVTAYDEHAVAAFEAEAVDYLLKPVERERLRKALERVGRRGTVERIEAALARLRGGPPPRITARSGTAVRFFDARRVARLSARRKYVVFRAGGSEHLTDESLDALEARLSLHGFLRVHRSELVNTARIVMLHQEGRSAWIELDTGDRVRVSRRRLPALRRALGLEPRR